MLAVAAATATLGLGLTARAQTNTPIAATGYTQDLILETAASGSASVGFDVFNNQDFFVAGLVSNGVNSSTYGTGVPTSGSFTSAANASTAFQLQPYAGPNALFLNNASNPAIKPYVQTTGTLTLASPTAFTNLAFCTSSTNGSQTVSYTLNYTDGSTSTGSFVALDWFTTSTTAALKGLGRAGRTTGNNTALVGIDTSIGAPSANPNMYEVDVAPAFTGKLIGSIIYSVPTAATGNDATAIWAVSGAANTAVTATPLTFTGTAGGAWDTSTANFASNGSPVVFANNGLNAVTFDDTAATTAVTVAAGGVFPAAVTFNNATANYTVGGGPIGGAGGLTLTGAGTVTLTAANTYTGTTTVNAGTLTLAAGGSIASGSVVVGSGGTFTVLAGGAATPAGFNLVNNGTVNFNNPARTINNLSGSGTLNLNGTALTDNGTAADLVYSGTINGTGSVAYLAQATVTGANTYTGGTTLANGSNVAIGSPTAFGAAAGPLALGGTMLSATTPLTAAAGGAVANPFAVNAAFPTVTFIGAANLELSGAGTMTAAGSVFNVSGSNVVTLSGPLSGGSLIKLGANPLVLTNPSNALTALNVSGGTTTFSAGSLGATTAVNLSGGTLQYAAGNTTDLTAGGRALNLNASGGVVDTNGNNVAFAGSANGANLGPFTKFGAGSLTVQGTLRPTNLYVNQGTLAATGTAAVINPSSTAYIAQNASNSAVVTLDGAKYNSSSALYVGNTGASTVGATPTTAVLNLLDTATTGNTSLTASSLYLGFGGSLAANQSFGAVNQTAGAVTVSASLYDGYFGTGVYNMSAGSAAFGSTTANYIGYANQSTGTVNLTGGAFGFGNASTGIAYLGYSGVGTVNLSGGTFTAVTLRVGYNSSSGVGTVNLNPGGTLVASTIVGNLGASNLNFNGGTLTANSSNTALIAASVNGAKVLAGGAIINTNGFNDTIAANLSSGTPAGTPDGGLIKTGTGTLTLAAAATYGYTGPTNVSGGALGFAPAAGTTQTFPLVISGVGGVVVTGPGTAVLSANNTYAGGTNVSGGVLQPGPGTTTPFGQPGTAINLSTGGLLGITNDALLTTVAATYTLNENGGGVELINYNSSLTNAQFGTTIGAATGTPSSLQPGALSGSGPFNYIGAGTLILNGANPNFSGTSNLSGGTLNVATGGLGTGNVVLNGGILQYAAGNTDDLTTGRTLTVGTAGGGIDTNGNNVAYAGGVLTPAAGTLSGPVTKYGAGTLTLNGTVSPTNLFVRSGTLALGPAAVVSTVVSPTSTAGDYASVGLSPGDNATLALTGAATLTVAGDFNVADNNNSTGTLNVGDTSVLTVRTLYVGKGQSTVGTVVQTGGVVQQANNGNASGAAWIIGGNGTTANLATGTYTLTGGTLNAAASQVRVAGGGVGTLTIGGTGTATSTGGFVVANAATGVGTVNLNAGGTLSTSTFNGGSGVSTVNFNGGTLSPTASGTAFLQGLTKANVQAGGLTLNTAGFNVTAAQLLQHDTTAGAPATDGGVTKTGAGVLTLTAANTYTGGTTVSAGTLAVSAGNALGTGPVSLNGGTLSLSGFVAAPTTTGLGAFTNGINTFVTGTPTPFTPTVANGIYTVTSRSTVNSASSTFVPISISDAGTFTLTFTYNHTTATGGSQVADGIAFGFQKDPRGLAAIGGNGGGQGYAVNNGNGGTAVTPSEVGYFDLYGANYGLGANGALTSIGTSAAVYNASGQTVTLTYNGPTKTFTSTLTNGSTVLTSTATVDLAVVLGGNAGGIGTGFFGFSGATGGVAADQSISNVVYSGNVVTGAGSIPNAVTAAAGTTSTLLLTTVAGSANTSIGTLTLSPGSRLNVATTTPGSTTGLRAGLVVAGLNASGGTLDLAANDLVVRNGSLASVTAAAAGGFNGGAMNGTSGLISSAAAANGSHLTTLGVVQNSVDGTTTGTPLFNTFDTAAVSATDVLVKYTYFGDANLDGKVDGSDYTRIDAGYAAAQAGTPATGWYNGDFNYDGTVDGSDYTLIDNAFNLQTAGGITPSLVGSPLLAVATSEIAGTAAVPEPTTVGVVAVAAAGLLARRRRCRA